MTLSSFVSDLVGNLGIGLPDFLLAFVLLSLMLFLAVELRYGLLIMFIGIGFTLVGFSLWGLNLTRILIVLFMILVLMAITLLGKNKNPGGFQ